MGSNVIVGGDFTSVIDTNGRTYPAARLARYLPATGTFDLSWAPSTTGPVYALAASGDRLIVGGSSTVRTYAAKVNLTTGVLDPTWPPTTTARVRSLLHTLDGSKIYGGGDFASVNGHSYAGELTLLSSVNATIDPAFRAGTRNAGSRLPVLSMALSGNALAVRTSGSGGGCTRLDATIGTTQWSKHGTGDIGAVAVFGPYSYCGGTSAETPHSTASAGTSSRPSTVGYWQAEAQLVLACGQWALAAETA